MQSPDTIKSKLFSLVNKGIKYDLDRMVKAASLCGDPHRAYLSVHVAGTNGKGSTCAYIESALRCAGYKTGLYTSPHIVNFEERFKVGGVDISEDVWFDVYKDQEEVISALGLTFFEAATLMSFEIFRRAGVEYAVFETGMGGRLDATNIVIPQVSVITKLALDHKEYLGDDMVAIAGEKLGIVKPAVPVVMLEPVDKRVARLAEGRCRDVGSELILVGADEAADVVSGDDGVSFNWRADGRRYAVSMLGEHQAQNAVLALNALKCIGGIEYKTACNGIKSAYLPGRFQVIEVGGRDVVVDVGHNPDAAVVLAEALKQRFRSRRVHLVIGMMGDKDIEAVTSALAPRASSFYFAKPKTDRAASPQELYALTEGKFSGRRVIVEDVGDAFRAALSDAAGTDVVCVTGSFYTVSEALEAGGINKSIA
ncbi:MAG: bifunctional folylpolyglutamate synthase/dihydrofolate synthase [Chitinispirillales bacterium]|jgi:dihydrofolate synthase/folylpolyglutamate synthase|nr:bifunctional folylpolyglutamate synthase/dihydrofolate synthase [Chitinispirillales bacterium]